MMMTMMIQKGTEKNGMKREREREREKTEKKAVVFFPARVLFWTETVERAERELWSSAREEEWSRGLLLESSRAKKGQKKRESQKF